MCHPCPVGTFCHIVGLHQPMGFSNDIMLEISMCMETITLYIRPAILHAIINLSGHLTHGHPGPLLLQQFGVPRQLPPPRPPSAPHQNTADTPVGEAAFCLKLVNLSIVLS